MRQLQEHMWKLVADGSGWEVELARRGVLDEAALEIEWVEEHALARISAQVEDGLCLAAITRVLVAGDVRTRFEVLDQFGNG